MATKIIHKRSSVVDKVPLVGDLSAGELALNTADAKIYMKNDAGAMVDVTASIYKKDTNVTVTDTGSNGTITAVADAVTVSTMTSNQISLTQDTAIENAKLLQLKELTANGVNYTGIKAADNLASSYNLTLPTATGALNQLLKTNGSGQLGWTDSDTFGSNRIYVSATKGNDANDGITAPVLTIKKALQIASGLVYTSGSAVNGVRINVIVSAGDYYENNPIVVPDNVTVKGDSLRSVNIRPLNANRDLLRVRNGCYFGEVTFRDGLSSGIPSYTFSYAVAFDDPLDTNTSRVGYTYLPTTKPVISQSPYVQNCTLLSFLGASGVLVDGSLVVTPNTPPNQIEAENPVSGLAPEQGKSMVANAFTMLSFGGTGWRIINDAYVQLVSCFQIFMLNGTYTQSGGYISITNSATNFGLYALRASGFSPNAFAFDKGYIGTTGTVGSIQTITAFGWTRPAGPVEEFVIQIYDPSTTANLTNSYKTALGNFLSVSFNSATAINTSTDTFTIVAHGLLNQDQVSYESNGTTQLGNIFDGDIFYIKKLTNDTFQLCYDDSLTKIVDITFAGVGTQNFIRQEYDMFVDAVTETHNTFQTLVLAAGSPSGYTFVIGDLVEGTTLGFPSKGYVYSYVSGTRTLTLAINKVTIGITETRNVFAAASSITQVAGVGVTYTVSTATARTDLYGADFEIAPTTIGGSFTNVATLPGKQIWFHRPSITNSSGHTWEYAGSGTDYNALPQNGGKSVPEYEQVGEGAGRVYTSGTNELGDFKVGNFITAFNRTGNVTFTNKITVDTLDVLRLGVGGVTVESISIDPELGNNEPGGPKDTRISTQLANYTYFQTHLGNVLDKSVSTNAIPGSLVQLNSNGQINADLIPSSRSFTNWSSYGIDSRLFQVDNIPAGDILSGDIATENFYQQELTLTGGVVTAAIGSVVIQTTASTATTAITSGSNTFTVTHSGAVTLTANTYVLIEGVTPAAYNGVWKINRAAAGTFTIFTNINPGTASVQGTIYYGGASGITKADYTAASAIIVGSVGDNFNTPFTATANTLIIGTDRTPSTTNSTVNPSAVTTATSATNNYFLRVASTGQYLIAENSASPVFTNSAISKAFRYNNNAYITSALAHNFVTNNEVKIDAATASFDATKEIIVTSATEFYYANTSADSTTSASTTATATLAGATAALTMTGSVATASLTGTITVGDFVFDLAGTIPLGSKITVVNMSVNPRTFTITFPATSTVASTTTATLKFFTPAVETGTIRTVITAADNQAQAEFLELRSGILTSVNNLSGLTGGTSYTNGIYYNVPLTNVSGSGVGALADITVASGAVTGVDVVFGGANYAVGNALSAVSVAGGFGNGTGSGFQILVNAIEKRIYVAISGGETFVATNGAPDFVEDNAATQLTATATTTVTATFNAASTGSGGGVDTVLNRITTLALHGFTNGDPVIYSPGSDPAVGGLISGNVYYAKVITTSTIELYNNYALGTIQVLSSSTGTGHTFIRKTVDIVNNTVTVPAHGFTTGDAFQIKGANLPSVSSVQIITGEHFFVGSITTNSFTIHELRSDALDSTAGVTIGASNLTAVGTGTITLIKNSIKITGVVNTSSQTRGNWNSLVATTIDASNIVSGIIATSRLATGSANNTTFLRGDSTWQTVVTSAAVAASSALSLTGSGSSPFYGPLTFDVTKVNSTGAVANYTAPGVASFNTVQFSVGTGSSLGAGQVLIRDNVIDAGTLQTRNLAYVLDSVNHTTQPVSVGGTGLTTYTQGDTLYASAATTLNKLGIGVANTVMTSGGTAPQWSPGLTIAKTYDATGAAITTSSTAQAFVFDSNARALAIGSAASSVVIGSNTASETFTTNVKSYTTGGSSSVTVTANVGLTGVISTVARNGSNVATMTTTANHGLTTGDTVTIVCGSDTGFNTVNAVATVTGLTTFTYANTGALVTTVAGTGSVFIGTVGMALGTTTINAETHLAFGSSPIAAGVRAGMLVQGNAFIPAGTTVSGVDATRVYLSAAVTGIISAGAPIAFTDTNTSLGIRTGDQVTVATSGDANINGTWPVTSAGATSTAFSFKVTTATTQLNLARAGTIVKESTFLIRNRNVTIGSSEASASPVAAVIKGENAVGTNIAGANITIQGGANTGSNTVGGNIVFRTPSQGLTGDATQSMTERMRIEMSGGPTQLDLTTSMASVNLFNFNATTVNAFAATTTLSLANVGTGARTINVATAATAGASTLTFGGAVTGNIIKLAGTAAGTVNLTTDVTSGGVEAWQSVTGTVKIGASGTITLGTSASAITTTVIGGAITGNTLKVAGTAVGTINLTTDVTTGIVNAYTGVTTGTVNLATGGASTTNIGGAAGILNIGTTGGDSILEVRGNATTGTATIRTNTGVVTANVFNTFATTGNLFGAATTIAIGAGSGTMTIGNPTVVGTQTTVNLWNTTSTTGNVLGVATAVNLATSAAAASTLTFGPAITANTFKIGSTAAGTINLTSDVTTGIVNAYAGVTTGTVNLATGGASTTNIGGAAAAVNIGTTGGDSTLTVRGNATTGTATLATNAATANVFNANATTVNIAGAGTAIGIGAATGTVTIANPTVTMNNATSVAFNMNGPTPTIASSNTGTASLFNANITVINFGQAAAISMGSTSLNTTVRGNLLVNGNTTIGDAAADSVTFNADIANVNATNNLTFVVDDATNANISYPVKFRHTTSGTATVGIGTGVQFVTENAAGSNIIGSAIESVSTNVTAAAEAFNLVFKTMTAGGTAAQVLSINNTTHTVGIASTAQTINTQTSSNLTVTTGATGATGVGNTLLVAAGAGGVTSGAGGAATFRGGEATTSGAGGLATFRSGDAAGTNIIGANTVVLAGNGTGSGGSGSVIFRTASAGSSGAAANTMVDRLTITNTGATTFSSDVTVGGNLTVNGTLTTLNSSTITVDDKNIELASVAIVTGLTVTITSGSGVITFIGASTSTGLLVGQTLTITSTTTGAPLMGALAVIQSVDSLTQVTMSVVATGTTGNAVVSSNGATDTTADGGGITILGTTNKTWNYVHANTAWTSNQNVDIFNTKTYKINATDVLSSVAVLQNAVTASIGSLAAATTVSVGAATQNNILNINGNGTTGTATTQTNVTSGILNEYVGVTGTINYGSAATTINMFNTATTAQTFQLGGASTGASTYSIGHGATAAATTKIINLGTLGVSTSITNINIGSAVSGATGTTAINSGTINLGTVQSAATTLNIGPAITGNTIKYASTAAGTVNVTTDVTTGIVNLFTGVTASGTVNLATAGAAAINIGGNAATVNVGGTGGNAVVEIRGNGTGGTATLRTNVTTGIVDNWQSVTGTINFGSSGAINLGTSVSAVSTVKVGGAITGNTLKIASTTSGTINLTTDVTTGAVSVFPSLTTATMTIGSAAAGRLAIAFNQASTSTTNGAVTIAGGLGVNGAVNALTKSFIIPHPTKPGKLLKHGSLEGPEFGVYTRGKANGKIIELPDYWTGLVDADTITVDLTPIGKHQKLYVERIEGNRVYINNEGLFSGSISCFYTVWGERKDVGKLDIEADAE